MANFGNDDVTLSEDSKQYLKAEMLRYDDTNKDGIISKDELQNFLIFIGINIPDEEAMDAVINLFDTNEDGCLSADEILNQWEQIHKYSLRSRELLECFEKIDKDKNGFITFRELIAVLTKPCGKHRFSGTDAAKIAQELKLKYDKDNDGRFCYSEFVQMYHETEFNFQLKERNKEKLPDAKVPMQD